MLTTTRMLEPRDLEILRSLLRLRYLTTRQIIRYFFSHERVGRRRLQKLSERGYIKLHKKGLPAESPLGAWRLTSKGLGSILDAFPQEHLPNEILERVADGSLVNLWERQILSQIYLELVVPNPSLFGHEPKVRQCRLWARQIRKRADQITWHPRHEKVLKYEFLGKRDQVIPDAVITSPPRKLRVFLHLDRTRRRRSIAGKVLQHYNRFFGIEGPMDKGFGDGYTPLFLYVVDSSSERRRAAIAKLLEKVGYRRIRCEVVLREELNSWLAANLLDSDGVPERRAA